MRLRALIGATVLLLAAGAQADLVPGANPNTTNPNSAVLTNTLQPYPPSNTVPMYVPVAPAAAAPVAAPAVAPVAAPAAGVPAASTAAHPAAPINGSSGSKARTSLRGAAKRLRSLDKRIDAAEHEGQYTSEQAHLLHKDIASIRLKLKRSADGSGPKLSGIEEEHLEDHLSAKELPGS
jgi:hypothetical protein